MIEGLQIGNYIKGCTGAIIKIDEVAMNFIKSSPKLYEPILLTGDLANILGCNNSGITYEAHTYKMGEMFYNGNIIAKIDHLHHYQNNFKRITGFDFMVNLDGMIDYFVSNLHNTRTNKRPIL